MTTKILSGHYASGYYLHGATTILSITASGYVAGQGLFTNQVMTKFTIQNDGEVIGGMEIYTPSLITNGSATDGSAFVGTGLVDGFGVGPYGVATVTNFATLSSASGGVAVELPDGGTIANGTSARPVATIDGGGVEFGQLNILETAYVGPGTFINYGSAAADIHDGVLFDDGGRVTNGSATDTTALIFSGSNGVVFEHAAGTVTNFGSITGADGYGVLVQTPTSTVSNLGTILGEGARGYGVELANGGQLTNGGSSNTTARIFGGGSGVQMAGAQGVVTNFGRIVGQSAFGADLAGGGSLTNGSNTDTKASISGYTFGANVGNGTVHNFGVISGGSGPAGGGVEVNLGSVFNGSSQDSAAVIEGYNGIVADDTALVVNYGAILGAGGSGVALVGGSLLNGVKGVIDGAIGVVSSFPATIYNFGAIQGVGGYGVQLAQGGELQNGAIGLIEGTGGVIATGAATVSNLGVIRGSTSDSVNLEDGGSLTNGSASYRGAQIVGAGGVALSDLASATNFGLIEAYGATAARLYDSSTLTNAGTIIGLGGAAVAVGLDCSLVVEPGCAFGGSVVGEGVGGLTLDGGAGTITLSTTDNVVVSGSMATTTFSAFGIVDIDAKSSETLNGTGSVPGFVALEIEGALAVAGKLNLQVNTLDPGDGGVLELAGTLSGAGTLSVAGGAVAVLETGEALQIGHVTLSAATSQADVNDASLTYAGGWTQNAGTLNVASGDAVTFTGVGDTFKGTLAGAGHVTLDGGSDTLNNLTIHDYPTIAGAGTVTATGTITMGGANTTSLEGGTFVIGVGTGGATFAGGTLSLGDSSVIIGASASSTLTNFNTQILGAGQLGDGAMRLVNDAAGAIDATSATAALVINTATVVVVNQGQMISFDKGGMIIDSGLSNSGLLEALQGNITVERAVSGAGSVQINSATADFVSTFTQNVAFVGAIDLPPVSGTLELGHSQTYTGTITGFTTTGTTALDLVDIKFASGTTTASYSGTTASGVLTVTDGTHTAHVNFTGNYTGSAWTVSSDGHGGTTVVDPAKTGPAPLAALVTAMAAFGPSTGAIPWHAGHPPSASPTLLGLPRLADA